MNIFLRFIIVIAAALACIDSSHAGEPLDVNAGVDVRIVGSNSDDSSLRGGYGSTRFDKDHEGLRPGSVYVSARYRLNDTLTLNGDALGYGDGHGSAVDVTQLYFNWRPFPVGPIRFSSKAGLFYPEFSMENRGHAWTPVYTITPSAVNSWYGEELHALGAEANIKWLGASVGYQGDVALIAGVYGWNDPLGVAVAFHGWNFHDRQTGAFDYLLSSASPGKHIHEMREIDGRPGFYAGLQWHHGDHLDVRLYRYDNRADPAAFRGRYAWLTRFNTLDVRWEVNEQWTAIAQMLRGETFVRPQPAGSAWNMDAWFVLLSRQMNSWRLSLRRDEFSNDQFRSTSTPHAYDDAGSAWTFAILRDFNSSWEMAAEWLRVNSTFPPASHDGNPAQVDQQWQLLLRYKWHY